MFAEPVLHVDMDAFFVEVERRRDPSLAGVPVVVGGLGPRGVVATASYEARRYGVHSALPIVRARRLCPQARFLPPDHGAYRRASAEVFRVLDAVTPLVEALSIDEAFLDVSGLKRHYPHVEGIAADIRARLRTELGLPASVGMARTKFLAKLASSHAKPDGQLLIPAAGEETFLHPLPVDQLWGVGQATRAALERLGLATVGDVAAVPIDILQSRLGAVGTHLWRLANGIDPRPVETGREVKSLSAEQTFPVALDFAAVERELLRLGEKVGRRLRTARLEARTITLKMRYDDFKTITRSRTLAAATARSSRIFEVARDLLQAAPRRPVRLAGIACSKLMASGRSRLGERKTDALDAAADRIRDRFGEDAVLPARLVDREPRRE